MPKLNLSDASTEALETSLHQASLPVQSSSIPLSSVDLDSANQQLAGVDASKIVAWAAAQFGEGAVMSTSFGIQSAVMLHLVTQIMPEIPVIWIDTGYLPAETYLYAEQLTKLLSLNLRVYQSDISPANMEALHGKLWESARAEDLNKYDQIRKVEPLQRALNDLQVSGWISGLRRDQTSHRRHLERVYHDGSRYRLHPILNWNSKQVYDYMSRYDLPQHPLWKKGFATVGDWHSSRPVSENDTHERQSRYRGKKEECGIHL